MSLIEINSDAEEHQFIKNNSRAVIFFGSANCGHCRDITPWFEDLVNKYGSIAFGHVETSRIPVADMDGAPTFAGYTDGVPTHMVLGADKPKILKMLDEL